MNPPLWSRSALHQMAAIESERTSRSGRGFSLVRIAPVGWAALDVELDGLARLVEAHLRRTDFVQRVKEREIGVVLIESVGDEVHAPVARVREAAAKALPSLELRFGWASVGPRQRSTWQEAWRWAGALLVAEGSAAAA